MEFDEFDDFDANDLAIAALEAVENIEKSQWGLTSNQQQPIIVSERLPTHQPASKSSVGGTTKQKHVKSNESGRQTSLFEYNQTKQLVTSSHFGANYSSAQPLKTLLQPFKPPVESQKPWRSKHELNDDELSCWIYPINYPMRDYQFNIVNTSLFKNTLVALPTGLGKTFLAAVVMYNFCRWFPDGKIVFMAPTKPLVAQQIEACFKITGIPQQITQEMTGTTNADNRRQMWKEKRVFFLTPQVMQNDLKSAICPAEDVVLVVVDEAHRATGSYAYSEVVKKLCETGSTFRVLALSATPGSQQEAVQSVITNLLIETIQIRTEESLDIRPYIFSRKVEEIVVKPNNQMTYISTEFSKVMRIYLARLNQMGALYDMDPSTASSYGLIQARDTWRAKRNFNHREIIESDFAISITLSQSMNLLNQHGISSFYTSVKSIVDEAKEPGANVAKSRLSLVSNPTFVSLMDHVAQLMKSPDFRSHEKLERLTDVILEHFSSIEANEGDEQQQSRVMVFSQYRDSVDEIVQMLNKHRPLLRVMSFIGQAAKKKGSNAKGFTQKEQLEVISKFQSGNYNILVSTSIGEEGLDIGEVDLIVCYDAQTSPVRMLQRMGRTGRKRQGRIVVLLAEGKEVNAHHRAQNKYKSVQRAIMDGQGKKFTFYSGEQSAVLPPGVRPVCEKKTLYIPPYQSLQKPTRKRQSSNTTAFTIQMSKDELEKDERIYGDMDPLNLKQMLSKYPYWNSRPLPKKRTSRTKNSKLLVDIASLSERMYTEEISNAGKRSTVNDLSCDFDLEGVPAKNPPKKKSRVALINLISDDDDDFLSDDKPIPNKTKETLENVFVLEDETFDNFDSVDSPVEESRPATPIISRRRTNAQIIESIVCSPGISALKEVEELANPDMISSKQLATESPKENTGDGMIIDPLCRKLVLNTPFFSLEPRKLPLSCFGDDSDPLATLFDIEPLESPEANDYNDSFNYIPDSVLLGLDVKQLERTLSIPAVVNTTPKLERCFSRKAISPDRSLQSLPIDAPHFKTPISVPLSHQPIHSSSSSDVQPIRQRNRNVLMSDSTPNSMPRIFRVRPRVNSDDWEEDGVNGEHYAERSDSVEDFVDSPESVTYGNQELVSKIKRNIAEVRRPRGPPRQRGTPELNTKRHRLKKRRTVPKQPAVTNEEVSMNPFMDFEAEISSNDEISADESEGVETEHDRNFINDVQSSQSDMKQNDATLSQHVIDKHAVYLHSLLSPEQGGLGFNTTSRRYRLSSQYPNINRAKADGSLVDGHLPHATGRVGNAHMENIQEDEDAGSLKDFVVDDDVYEQIVESSSQIILDDGSQEAVASDDLRSSNGCNVSKNQSCCSSIVGSESQNGNPNIETPSSSKKDWDFSKDALLNMEIADINALVDIAWDDDE